MSCRRSDVWYKAICASNALRRGVPQSAESNRKRSRSVKLAWKRKSVEEREKQSNIKRKVIIQHWSRLSAKERKTRGRAISKGWTTKSRKKASISKKKHCTNPKLAAKHRQALIRRSANPDYKKRILKAWCNPERRRKQAESMAAKMSSLAHPNKQEKKLARILHRNFPGEFRMNVRKGIVIEGKVPDFVNVNGKKILVELFGVYWHTVRGKQQTRGEAVRRRRAQFRKSGFTTVIIWGDELNASDKVIAKVGRFVRRKEWL